MNDHQEEKKMSIAEVKNIRFNSSLLHETKVLLY
jgi:hypothetical protein